MSAFWLGVLLVVAIVLMVTTSVSTLLISALLSWAITDHIFKDKQVSGGNRPLSINISQNGTVRNMRLNCDMNSTGTAIDCSTDAQLLYQPETMSSTLIHAPLVGTAYKLGKHAMKVGEEYVDRATGQPYGTTANHINESAADLSNRIQRHGFTGMFKSDNNGSNPLSSWLHND
jgi:hypothetical protein